MRVLHVYTHHRGGGGAENFIRSTIELSRRHGMDVEVFSCNSNELSPGFLGRLAVGISAFHAPGSIRRFREALESFRPDVVHAHDLFPLISPRILGVCQRKGIPVVLSCEHYRLTCPVVTHFREGKVCTLCPGGREHWAVLKNCRGNVAESVTVALYSKFESSLHMFTRNVDLFLAPSDFTREWLLANTAISPDKIATLFPFPEIPEDAADAGEGQYVGFAGRFVPEKGIDTVLETARLTGIPFRLSRHATYLVRVDLPPSAEVVVTNSRDDLRRFFRGARMLVYPSIWYETFGLAAAEAMSHGIPLIASRIGALSELVEDGVDGFLFEPGNCHALAEKVAILWNNPELARRMGQAARQKAMRLWRPELHMRQLRGLYETVCARKQALSTPGRVPDLRSDSPLTAPTDESGQ